MFKNSLLISTLLISSLNAEYFYSGGKKIELTEDRHRSSNKDITYYRDLNNKLIGVDNTILLKLNDGVSIDDIESEYSITFIKKVSKTILLFKINGSNSTVFNSANALYSSGKVKFAHPNLHIQRVKRAKRTVDPLYSKSWHLSQIDVSKAWEYSKGADIKIGIIDDAVDMEHEDLKDNIAYGYDFDNYDSDPSPDSNMHTHGTNCAGLIVAVADNNLGGVGVAPQSKLYPVKWNGTSLSTTIEALEWLKEQDIDVISNSWGTYDMYDALDDEFWELATYGRDGKGIILVFASGNDAYNLDEPHPNYGTILNDESESQWVIGVGATNSSDMLAYYSNYGDNIDILAPAGQYTTDVTGYWGESGEYTDIFGGTSASAPVLTGVVALILGANPDLTKSEVEDILKSTADKVGDEVYDSNGFNEFYAYGRVNAYEAVLRASELNGTVAPETLIDINSLQSGWHLLAAHKELNSLKDAYSLKALWTYKDGLWSKNPTQIEKGRGFWILK
jgi:subtilisin family serine protease